MDNLTGLLFKIKTRCVCGCVLDESHLTDKKDYCTFEWDDQVPLAAVITSKELANSNLSREDQGSLDCNSANQPREDHSSIPDSESFSLSVDYEAGEQSSESAEDDVVVGDNSNRKGHNNQGTSSISNKQLHVTSITSDKQLQETSSALDKLLRETSDTLDKQQLQEKNNYILASSSKAKNKETEQVDHDDIPLQRRLEMESETEKPLELQTQNGSCVFRRNLLQNQCPRCRMVFPCVMLFREHVNVCAPKFICNNCSKVFRTPSLVVRHMRIHTGERPYQCEICKSSFNQKEILQRHIAQRHATNRPYKCKMCPKAYALPLLLSAHIRASHYVQNFKCNLCPKKFCHASGLSRHQHLHNGTIYICKMCSKRFSDASSIRRHIKVHNIMDNNSDSESESVEGDA
ncbi:hypothetical protein J6590_060341 [Homalodisca vitripennis]|nr:hypothetical protein J6590_060341 [Homalodisca vitripennis]